MKLSISIVVALLLAAVLPARAQRIPCGPVEPGNIRLDGLLLDWRNAEGVVVGEPGQVVRGKGHWSGPKDLSFEVYCNLEENKTLYLAVRVTDEYFVCTRGRRGNDHLEVALGRGKLLVHPGDLDKVKARLRWKGPGGARVARRIKMAEAMQRRGYSVELKIPLSVVPGYRKGKASLRGGVRVADSDSKAGGRIQTVLGTYTRRPGEFVLAEAASSLGEFLQSRGLGEDQIRWRKGANLAGDKGEEQVVQVGRSLALFGLPEGAYVYIDLPVRSPADIAWVKVKDLDGDGLDELLSRYTQRSENGRRELVAVLRYRQQAGRLEQIMAHEVLKAQGKRRVRNRFSLRPWRKGKRRGADLVFDRARAEGYSEDNYLERPSSDATTILLPWGAEKRRRFRMSGGLLSEQ